MAKRINKKTQREIERVAKKHPWLVVVALILVVVIATLCVLHYKRVVTFPFLEGVIPQEEQLPNGNGGGNGGGGNDDEEAFGVGGTFTATDYQTIKNGQLSIHFLELGNAYTGDCTLIKVGDTEVLIDAGSRQGSAPTIKAYLEEFCTDGTLEYVIATHAHRDHIAGFVGNSNKGTYNGILYSYRVENLIQFAQTNQDTGDLYLKYCDAVEYAQSQGTSVYTALECSGNEYVIGTGITMKILYHDYYATKLYTDNGKEVDENDYSVCVLLQDGVDNYLFTGDLEAKGEASLLKHNPDLPKCKLFKGAHHGSYTASTAELLAVIQPEIVCVCCCCGSTEYTTNMANVFPSQAFVDRVAPYTDKIYVTTLVSNDANKFTSMNGNIVLYKENDELLLRCSNNVTKFKDTEWFKQNRVMPNVWR